MTHRIPLLVALGLGCLALAWGLFSLNGIFIEERDDALEAIHARRAALEQYAHKELERRLSDRLRKVAPAMDAAATDPLRDASGMWLVDRGNQLLPRLARTQPGSDTPARRLYEQLKGGPLEPLIESEQARDPTSPWGERLMLLDDLRRSLDEQDREAIERGVRRILAHKASYLLVASHDLPYTAVLLSDLSERSTPQRSLMEALLREGLTAGPSRIRGMQRELLDSRQRFTRADLEFLSGVIVTLCERAQVTYGDFSQRVKESGGERLVLPSPLDEPTLAYRGTWYLEPQNRERIRGVEVELAPMLTEITAAMRERALIEEGDSITGEVATPTLPLSQLTLEVQSARWQPAIDAVHGRYRLKSFLELLIAVLVFGVMALGAIVYRRRQRFLELKSDFVSAVSHELRTPLASIRLMAETLERRTKDLPRAKDYPARIVRDIDGLSLLVENILSFNRLSRGRWTPKLEQVRLEEVVDKLEQHKDSWARDGRAVELTSAVDGAELVADPDLLQLLLTNLARNAVQYSRRDPARIRIEAAREQSAWLIRVRDNGVGIDSGDAEKIFDDFYRSGMAKSSGERGSGLGLAISRKIMEAHGGTIRVAETSEQGTTFELRFADRV